MFYQKHVKVIKLFDVYTITLSKAKYLYIKKDSKY